MASALVGCSALFRWDQGIFGLGALAGALAFWLTHEGLPRPSRASFRVVAWAFLPAMGIIAMVYVPLIISAGADLFVEDVLIHSLRDFEAYRGIRFVRPQIWGILRALEQGRPGHALLQSIPLVLISLTLCLVSATLVRACFRARSPASSREIFDDGTLTAAVFLALVVLGLLNQMRIRPEVSRSMLVAAAATPLCAFWWRLCVPRTGVRLRTAALGALALAIAVLVAGAASAGYDLAWRRERVVTESPYARFIRNPVHEPQYNALLAYVRQHTQPGERIFSGVTDHQVLFINDAMVYFLTGRDGPTRFYEMDPGLANTPQAQEHIVAALDKMPVRLLVLWDLKSTEDNLSSRPNGVDTLDRYIRLKYRLRATFGSYQVWMREEDALAKPP